MSSMDNLENACINFSKKLEKLRVGASKYETEKPIEEKILVFKKINQMLNSQVRVTKLASLHRTKPAEASFNVEEESEQILTDVLEQNVTERCTNTALLGYGVESILTNDQPRMQLFKEKIIEQLEYLETTSEKLKKLNNEQLEVLDESMSLRQEIMLKQNEYSEELKKQVEENRTSELNSTYNEQLDAIKQRIKKINFMSTLINRILIYGKIKWEDNEHYMAFLEEARTKHTVETLLEL